MKRDVVRGLVAIGLLATALLPATSAPVHAEGPSFNCRYAKAPDEVLICQDERLAALDSEMAGIYSDRINNDVYDKRWFRAKQVAWLKQRHACGYNYECISEAYSSRLNELSVVYAETYNYSCKVGGKTYPLLVDETKMSLEWRGKQYSLTVQPDCAKYGWHAEGNGTSFDFCTATQGYAAIEDNEQVQCNLKR